MGSGNSTVAAGMTTGCASTRGSRSGSAAGGIGSGAAMGDGLSLVSTLLLGAISGISLAAALATTGNAAAGLACRTSLATSDSQLIRRS